MSEQCPLPDLASLGIGIGLGFRILAPRAVIPVPPVLAATGATVVAPTTDNDVVKPVSTHLGIPRPINANVRSAWLSTISRPSRN